MRSAALILILLALTSPSSATANEGAGRDVPISIPERMMHDLTSDLDLNRIQAAAIIGNLAQETGNFRFMQEMNPLRGRGGLGYSQWTGSRRVSYEQFAAGQDLLAYNTNYAFLLHELRGPYQSVIQQLRTTTSIEAATRSFMRNFLIPHPNHANLPARLAYARDYMAGDFTGAGCYTLHQTYAHGQHTALRTCGRDTGGQGHAMTPASTDPSSEETRIQERPESRGLLSSLIPIQRPSRRPSSPVQTAPEALAQQMQPLEPSPEMAADDIIAAIIQSNDYVMSFNDPFTGH